MDIDELREAARLAGEEIRSLIDTLTEQAEALESGEADFDDALSGYAGMIADTLDEEYARVDGDGPGEGEDQAHHDAWLEGFQAAIDHLRDQYGC